MDENLKKSLAFKLRSLEDRVLSEDHPFDLAVTDVLATLLMIEQIGRIADLLEDSRKIPLVVRTVPG